MGVINKKWILKSRPKGLVEESNFELLEENLPDIGEGQVLIQTEYLSVDPTQRMWLTDVPGYLPPIQIDEVIRSGGMGRIIQSKNKKFKEGDYNAILNCNELVCVAIFSLLMLLLAFSDDVDQEDKS